MKGTRSKSAMTRFKRCARHQSFLKGVISTKLLFDQTVQMGYHSIVSTDHVLRPIRSHRDELGKRDVVLFEPVENELRKLYTRRSVTDTVKQRELFHPVFVDEPCCA